MPEAVGEVTVAYEDSRVRWVWATSLVRTLHDRTIVDPDELDVIDTALENR